MVFTLPDRHTKTQPGMELVEFSRVTSKESFSIREIMTSMVSLLKTKRQFFILNIKESAGIFKTCAAI